VKHVDTDVVATVGKVTAATANSRASVAAPWMLHRRGCCIIDSGSVA